jgi:hypothetical protein
MVNIGYVASIPQHAVNNDRRREYPLPSIQRRHVVYVNDLQPAICRFSCSGASRRFLHLLQFRFNRLHCNRYAMTVIDCAKLHGRMRAICEGTSGLAPEVEEQYRRLWAGNIPPDPPPRRIRLGDWLASFIHAITFGRIIPCVACNSRRARLNQWGFRVIDALAEVWKS